jgi:hypothetical protein
MATGEVGDRLVFRWTQSTPALCEKHFKVKFKLHGFQGFGKTTGYIE